MLPDALLLEAAKEALDDYVLLGRIGRDELRLRIMGREGDRQIEWSRDDPDSLLMAAHELEQWIAQPGYRAFGFKRLHLDAGERLDAFDPEAAEIVLVPQMRGG